MVAGVVAGRMADWLLPVLALAGVARGAALKIREDILGCLAAASLASAARLHASELSELCCMLTGFSVS
jgi:hypothetical protein